MSWSTNGAKTFTITSQPYYDQYNQCYKNIMMVNIEPQGPLRQLIRQLKLPRLSPFQREGPCNPIQQCGLAIQSLNMYNQYGSSCCVKSNSGCDLMSPNQIPDLISFLESHGYQIETQITNMLNQSEIKMTDKRLAFTATYYGTNQPNITYMR
jgi:hypothetical protein